MQQSKTSIRYFRGSSVIEAPALVRRIMLMNENFFCGAEVRGAGFSYEFCISFGLGRESSFFMSMRIVKLSPFDAVGEELKS